MILTNSATQKHATTRQWTTPSRSFKKSSNNGRKSTFTCCDSL